MSTRRQEENYFLQAVGELQNERTPWVPVREAAARAAYLDRDFMPYRRAFRRLLSHLGFKCPEVPEDVIYPPDCSPETIVLKLEDRKVLRSIREEDGQRRLCQLVEVVPVAHIHGAEVAVDALISDNR